LNQNIDNNLVFDTIQKIREKHGLKKSYSPFAKASSIIGLIFVYSSIASGMLPRDLSTSLDLILFFGITLVAIQTVVIRLLGIFKISRNKSIMLSYFLISIIVFYFGSLYKTNLLYNILHTSNYISSFIGLYITIILFSVLFSYIFSLVVMIPVLFVRLFLKVNYQMLSIPLAIVLIQIFNKSTWEYSSALDNYQLLSYIFIIAILPTIISLYIRKKVILEWIDSKLIYFFTMTKDSLIENISHLFSNEIKTELINSYKEDVDLKLKTNRLNKIRQRYTLILFLQPFLLYLLIIMIISIVLSIFPNSIIYSWTSNNINIIDIIIKESIILGSLAYTSLNLSMFSTKENLIKMYNEVVLNRFNEDVSLEILHELITKYIRVI
jgi:hypothetical protein